MIWDPLSGMLNTEVSLWAIQLLDEDRKSVRSCTCVLRPTKGFPCRHKVQRCLDAGQLLQKTHLHRFWATLDYCSPPDAAEWEDEATADYDN